MTHKARLRTLRAGTVINLTSSRQESVPGRALKDTVEELMEKFDCRLVHHKSWKLCDIVDRLSEEFPAVGFHCHHTTSFMQPDGGILSLTQPDPDKRFPILITEVKNQGTNDRRHKEGLKKQAMGNAIERLGKNVIGLRVAMRTEGIVPFVCFGDGRDFVPNSSILDRVSTISMFGKLNTTEVVDLGPDGVFDRGSFYFREKPWSEEEMRTIMTDIAERSIHYYLAKYGNNFFEAASGS